MRIYWIKLFFIFFFIAILTRLFYWQIVRGDFLQAQAEQQHQDSIEIQALRGNIFFSDGSILASSNPTFNIFGLPKAIPEDKKLDTAYTLAKILANDSSGDTDTIAKDILSNLSKNLYWVSLGKGVSLQTKREIEGLKLTGIGFEQTSSRFYPEGSSSAHLLGFVGSDERGGSVGYFGLEGFYDGELRGVPGQMNIEKDANGVPIFVGNFQSSDAKNGKDITLNIDRTIQFYLENALKEGIEKYGAKGGLGVVADPKTGAILAMASFPNYDPATYFDFPRQYYKNPVIADQYEPGSTFKVLVMSAAINEGVVKPDTTCNICAGPVSSDGFLIRTWNNQYFPNTTMTDVIVHSDNTGMVFVARKLGLDKFYQYLQDFGFGQTTGIDLQEEVPSEIKPKNTWKDIDLATASFGQGIAITPIQMVRAVSVIANGGYLMEPHMVKTITDGYKTYQIKPKIVRRVIKESTAKTVTEIMVKAVNDGEAKWTRLKGYQIAGKTGTAQIPVAGHYDPTKTIASFVGFAPADDPKFVILIRYNQPSSSIYGSETAAPTFFEVAKQILNYYNIVPTSNQ